MVIDLQIFGFTVSLTLCKKKVPFVKSLILVAVQVCKQFEELCKYLPL